MPKYALTVLIPQHLTIQTPDGQLPYVVENGLFKLFKDNTLIHELPAANLIECALLPEESKIVKPGDPS